jgi:ABC-type xylose transport system substrate-binding protein
VLNTVRMSKIGRTSMKLLKLMAATLFAAFFATTAYAQMTVGVSWSNFQEERWKTDEAAIVAALEAAGALCVDRRAVVVGRSSFPTLKA